MASNTEAIVWNEDNQVKYVGIRPGYTGDHLTAYDSANNGTVVIYTVPVGKILLLFNSRLSGEGSIIGGGAVLLWLTNAVPANLYLIEHLPFTGTLSHTVIGHSRFVPIPCPAGYTITVASPAATQWGYGGIEGILVDA